MSAADTSVSRLRFDGTINVPTLVGVVTLIVLLAGGWSSLTQRVTKVEEAQAAGFVRGQGRDAAIAELRASVRALELAQSRTDEKFTAIMGTLQRIERSLDPAP